MTEPYRELEQKLRPLADPLPRPRPGDWLAEHPEPGQTFAEYRDSQPIRKGDNLNTIYVCSVGEFSKAQQRILRLTEDYLAIVFDCSVKRNQRISLDAIPANAKRIHPSWGDAQVLTTYLLHDVLEPERPADALAYLAFTASDLWPGRNWNFVFGQANLRKRIGVWSIYRNGDPATEFDICLRRTLSTASHETGHILGMAHCTACSCLMNGSNHQAEKDQRPLHLCPVCLRKLCWNLQVEPDSYLTKLEAFCRKNGIGSESEWYDRAISALTS